MIGIDGAFFVDPHDVDRPAVPGLPEFDGWLVQLTPDGRGDVLLTFVKVADDERRLQADLRWASPKSDVPTGAIRSEMNLEVAWGLRDFAGARIYCASNTCRQASLHSQRRIPLVARAVHVAFPLAAYYASVGAPPDPAAVPAVPEPLEVLVVITHESQATRPSRGLAAGAGRGRIEPAGRREPLVARLAPTEIICRRCHRRGWVRQVL